MMGKVKGTRVSAAICPPNRFLIFVLALVFSLSFFGSLELSSADTTQLATAAEVSLGLNSRSSQGVTKLSGQSKFTTLEGVRVHYVNYGKGDDAIVLIHGWTMNVDNWREQVSALAEQHRVVVIDLPGHGQSDKPKITYSMDLFARAVDAVMRDEKVKRAVLVGHSMGTPIARQFYRQHPEKTLAIVIVDGPLRPFGDKASMDNMIAGFRAPTYREAVNKMLTGMYGPKLSAEARERITASSVSTPQHVLVGAMEGMADSSIWGDDKINVPVLAIMAKNPFFGPDLETLFRRLAPKVEFHMWEGVGHFLMMDRPKDFNDLVLAFLDKNKL
jgi:pimeloyl-ACP methyl ester carboxylesterase